jgi:lysophospholipase L1-like esterase
MKKFLSLILLCSIGLFLFFSCSCSKPTARDVAIQKAKAWYDVKVDSFRKENDSLRTTDSLQTHIVFLGDSFTERLDLRKAFPGMSVLNRGITSDHIVWDDTRGVIYRLAPELLAAHPSHIVLLIGVNDLGDDNSPERIAFLIGMYRQTLNSLRATYPAMKICVCTLVPAGGKYARLNESIRAFNAKLKSLAETLGITLLDLYPLYSDSTGALRRELTTDGLHIIPAAYDPWIEQVRRFLAGSR